AAVDPARVHERGTDSAATARVTAAAVERVEQPLSLRQREGVALDRWNERLGKRSAPCADRRLTQDGHGRLVGGLIHELARLAVATGKRCDGQQPCREFKATRTHTAYRQAWSRS